MADTAFVLIVRNEPADGEKIAAALKRANFACHVAGSGDDALESIRRRPPDVVIADDQLNGGLSGLDVVREAKQANPDAEAIILAGNSAGAPPREAPFVADGETVIKPFVRMEGEVDPESLREKVSRAARQAIAAREARMLRRRADEAYEFCGIVGVSDSIRKEIKRLKKIARSKSPILIVGETGCGKELFAQAIHQCSPRAGKPFKVLNCAAVSETLLESELFGHAKGAFTGAVADRKGLIQAADGGTLFLDEIGDMPLPMQAKLLRTIETGEVLPVGRNDMLHFDVRFVAATNHDLSELVQKNRFREDLYYRLHADGAIRIPPLRQRREDISVLVPLFIEQANREHETTIQGVSGEVMRKLLNYNWPGNVRELRNVIFRMCLEAEGPVLQVEDLPERLRSSTDIVPAGPPNLAGMTMADVEKLHIMNTLRMFGGNREKTAKALGIGARTLYRKLRDYGLR